MSPRRKVSLAERLTEGLLALDGIAPRSSRFSDAPAFFVGKREILHFHGPNEVDVRLTKRAIRERGDELALAEDLRVTRRSKSSEWVEVRFDDAKGVARALALAKVALDYNRAEA